MRAAAARELGRAEPDVAALPPARPQDRSAPPIAPCPPTPSTAFPTPRRRPWGPPAVDDKAARFLRPAMNPPCPAPTPAAPGPKAPGGDPNCGVCHAAPGG